MQNSRISDLNDIVLLSGINLKRNFADILFPGKLEGEQLSAIREDLLKTLADRFPGVRLDKRAVKHDDSRSLHELCEEACFYDDDGDEDDETEGALRVSLAGSTRLSVTINRGDHLNFSAFIQGSDIQHVPGIILPMEKALSRDRSYAFDKNWGYLTSSVKYTGNALTGMHLLQLTGLNRMGLLDDERESLKGRHMELKRLFGDDEDDCELFCLYGGQQLGKSAADVLQELRSTAEELCYREKDALEELIYDDTDDFADSVMRALGILMNARLMDFEEFLGMYADVRAGISTGFAEGSLKDIDDIASEVSPEEIRRNYPDIDDRDEELIRADICRRRFSERLKTIKI